MTSAKDATPTKRRGRRPAGEDTRAALLEAARAVFAEGGYDGATVRAIAARAGVDAAMVNHWFGGKEGLFAQAVLQVPFDFRDVLDEVTADGPQHLGRNIVRAFVTRWDGAGGEVFTALVRSVTAREEALHLLKETLVSRIFAGITSAAGSDQAELRAGLCASQVIGLGMARYVARMEPLASADIDTLVETIAPTLQRYLTGDIGFPG
ncbi:AcrR family transcriptional regulator [Saccharomonospora amisosensis]|uniref:AcrR family transcriptional regulator n=1 Tax=Saccharomonospora amisosensis TaxID=1128677 RepID=A0A7X5UNA7_9PSEU|nr:TetR family transcriptional regulator [Saccharomonospora amisosensis]NIJ11149.1 AcrR family transcriptional regulator [Saccharomonospora amisosensis]